MKSLEEFMSQANDTITDGCQSDSICERFVSGAIVSGKLNTLKNRVLSEKDPKKQNDILAKMIHYGLGTIATVTNSKR